MNSSEDKVGEVQKEELIFVYNANSGIWNAALDTAHKLFSPKTYSCNLCAIIYGNFDMKKEWTDFIEKIAIPVRFLHKDEWEKEFERNEVLPAVFLKEGDQLKSIINAKELNEFDLKQLKNCIDEKLKVESK